MTVGGAQRAYDSRLSRRSSVTSPSLKTPFVRAPESRTLLPRPTVLGAGLGFVGLGLCCS
jgi:hypothetical protein